MELTELLMTNRISPPLVDRTIDKLKVGLIVDSEFVSKYVYELAEWGQLQNDLSIAYLIILQRENIERGKVSHAVNILKNKGLKEPLKLILWTLIYKVEMRKLRGTIYKDHLRLYDLNKVISNSLVIQPRVSDNGLVYHLSKDDVDKVRSLNLDLLIKCSSDILRGDILSASRLGIISFDYADIRMNRDAPPGFWEVHSEQEKTGFMIQQITEELDGGNILIRGAFLTQNYYLLNQAQLYTRSNFYMRKLLTKIAQYGNLPAQGESLPYFNRLLKAPEPSTQIKYISSHIYRKVRNVVTGRLLRKTQRWGVAFCRTNWRNLVMWRAIKIEPPPNHFLADPFVITEANRDYCFAEDYDYNRSKGCISVYELKENSALRLGEAISESFHVSFPYLFRFNSKIYMVPETGANKEIRLYECVNFPLEWRLCKVLMSGISAVDTMIFEYKGVWWLFTNINLSGIANEHCSELSIFYSETPLTDDWKPHLKNPIFIDPSKARNAGILFHKGEVYRVNQRQGVHQYGKGFSINRISVLNCESYEEITVCSVEPSFFENLKGTHHLHCDGNISVFDYYSETSRGSR